MRAASMELLDTLQKEIRPRAERLLRVVLKLGMEDEIREAEDLIAAIDRASDVALRGDVH